MYGSELSPTTDASITACALCYISEVTRRVQHLAQQVGTEGKPATISQVGFELQNWMSDMTI